MLSGNEENISFYYSINLHYEVILQNSGFKKRLHNYYVYEAFSTNQPNYLLII